VDKLARESAEERQAQEQACPVSSSSFLYVAKPTPQLATYKKETCEK